MTVPMAEILTVMTLKSGLRDTKLDCKIGLVFEKYELDSECKQQNQDDNVVSTDRHPSTRHKNILNITKNAIRIKDQCLLHNISMQSSIFRAIERHGVISGAQG